MSRRFVLFALLCGIVAAPSVYAQDHAAIGAYVDYFRLAQTDTNFAGLGGRFGRKLPVSRNAGGVLS